MVDDNKMLRDNHYSKPYIYSIQCLSTNIIEENRSFFYSYFIT